MFQQFEITKTGLSSLENALSSSVAQAATPVDASALAFLSGPQFFIALIAGVVMAFAFQFLLSNLSIAAGISAGINPAETHADGWGRKIRRIEAKVGSTTILIVNTALFTACFLAVKLTLIHSAGLGAIVAVVIWSVYFLLLLWVSSQAIGSLVGAVGNTASSGIQGVMATVATALSGQAASNQITNTVETSVSAVSRELQSALTSERLRESLENYLSQLKLPQPNASQSSSSQSGASFTASQALNLLSNSLPSGDSDLLNIIKSATPEDLASGQLRQRLTQALGIKQPENGNGNGQKQGVGLRERTLQLGTDTLIATLIGRGGLSTSNIENLTKSLSSLGLPGLNPENLKQSLSSLGQQLTNQPPQAANQSSDRRPSSVIRSDIETYLLNSPSWYLRPDSLDRGFREVLLDPDADAGQVRHQLEQINRAYFVDVLKRRQGAPPDQINDIADELELIRREVLDTVCAAEEQARVQELRRQVETYLKSAPKEALQAEGIQQDFTALLTDPEATYETIGNRLLQFDRDSLMQLLLAGRQDLSPEETEQILNELEGARDRFLNQSQETWNYLQHQAIEFRQQVEAYLRETNSTELTPEAIQQTFQVLLEVPESGLLALRTGLRQLDRTTLEQVLTQRQDLNQAQTNQVIEQVEAIRDGVLHTPPAPSGQAKEQVDRLTTQIADYLRNINLNELNPEGIQRDLRQLLENPQAGISSLRARLSQIDRDTLVNLLSNQGLDESQVNQAIDQVLAAAHTIAQTPREFAVRTRDRVRDFSSDLADYLRHTNRDELNPESIQRDLRLLIRQPQAGIEQLGDRLSQVDRGTLVALLSQREDISEAEANRIADQVAAVYDQLIEQVRSAQSKAQSVVDNTVGKVRDSLNALDQPELNYDGIQRDLRKLFDDPEAGLEALRDRLSQFDRETLVALLSLRSDLSKEQANQIVDQIEAARDGVLQRAERLQAKAEQRLSALKHQAKEQAEEVQKTVATAAWWLFGTAITSVTTAAIAGVLAAVGFNFGEW